MDCGLNQYPFLDLNIFGFKICEPKIYYERDLVKQWFQIPTGEVIETKEGRSLIIIHHGTINKNKGPDIKDAVLFIQSNIIRGDVECHLNERDWYTHHHDKDLNYKRVVLHIAHQPVQKIKSPIKHTILLKMDSKRNCSLTKDNLSAEYNHLLQNLSEKRWQEHIQSISEKNYLSLIAKILGKGGNEENFKLLVKHINVKQLISLNNMDQINIIESTSKLLNIDWEHCSIRPAHWPEKRFSLLIELVTFISPTNLSEFTVYETFFYTLSAHCASGGKSILTECIVNYFLPLLAVQAIKINDIKQYAYWKSSWHQLYLQNPYGFIFKKFGNVFSRKELTNVGNTQGLLYLDKQFCQKGFCIVCPLKSLEMMFPGTDFNSIIAAGETQTSCV